MDRAEALAPLTRYYAAFNAGDREGMLDCLGDGVVHDINQGDLARLRIAVFRASAPCASC